MPKGILLLCLFFGAGLADVQVVTPITYVYAQADSVFLGRVSSIHQLPQREETKRTDWRFEFASLRVYKSPAVPSPITVDICDVNPSWGPPGYPGDTLLVFASRSSSASYFVPADRRSLYGFGLAPEAAGHGEGIDRLEDDAVTLALGNEWASSALGMLQSFPELKKRSLQALSEHGPFTDTRLENIRLELLGYTDAYR